MCESADCIRVTGGRKGKLWNRFGCAFTKYVLHLLIREGPGVTGSKSIIVEDGLPNQHVERTCRTHPTQYYNRMNFIHGVGWHRYVIGILSYSILISYLCSGREHVSECHFVSVDGVLVLTNKIGR